MTELPENFFNAAVYLADKLQNINYCFRGTTSLVLQGYDMNVDDIDILTGKENALECNGLLQEYIKDEIEYKESPKFKSYFGSFLIGDVPGEVMGDWQILDTKGVWSRVYNADEKINITVKDHIFFVTPPALELEFFVKMGRWAAFNKLKKQLPPKKDIVEDKPQAQLSLL
jgi:hypothetical protein